MCVRCMLSMSVALLLLLLLCVCFFIANEMNYPNETNAQTFNI